MVLDCKNGVLLKPSKEVAVVHRHHWIFSGAIAKMPTFENGATLPVFSAKGHLLGHGYFNSKTSIAGRMLSFGEGTPEEAVRENIRYAIQMRHALFPDANITDSYRLINAEGDGLPGLIVDKYEKK